MQSQGNDAPKETESSPTALFREGETVLWKGAGFKIIRVTGNTLVLRPRGRHKLIEGKWQGKELPKSLLVERDKELRDAAMQKAAEDDRAAEEEGGRR